MSVAPAIPDLVQILVRTVQMLRSLGDPRCDILAFLIQYDLQAPFPRKVLLERIRTWDEKSNNWKPVPERHFDRALKWLLVKGLLVRIGREETGSRAAYYRVRWLSGG